MTGVEDLMDKMKSLDFAGKLKSKYDQATLEEQKQHDEIKSRLSVYFRNKDYSGATAYLKHVRPQLK